MELVNLSRIKFARYTTFSQAPRCHGDIPASTVIGGNHEVHTPIVTGQRLSLVDIFLNGWRESRPVTHHRQTNIVGVQLSDFALERNQEQLHQRTDFGLGATPVFAGESKQCQGLDTALRGTPYYRTHGFNTGMVATYAGQATRTCPAVIAIHDDCHMLRQPISGQFGWYLGCSGLR